MQELTIIIEPECCHFINLHAEWARRRVCVCVSRVSCSFVLRRLQFNDWQHRTLRLLLLLYASVLWMTTYQDDDLQKAAGTLVFTSVVQP